MTRDERGLTLIEILVALAIFAVVAVGALGTVGANNAGGMMAAFSTGLLTGRVAKDTTVASVYLQGLQEYVAANIATVAPGLYCTQGSGSCTSPSSPPELSQWCPGNNYSGSPAVGDPAGLSAAPLPAAQPYQLNWDSLYVLVEPWYWNESTKEYSSALASGESLVRLCSVLLWDLKGETRMVRLDRFVP